MAIKSIESLIVVRHELKTGYRLFKKPVINGVIGLAKARGIEQKFLLKYKEARQFWLSSKNIGILFEKSKEEIQGVLGYLFDNRYLEKTESWFDGNYFDAVGVGKGRRYDLGVIYMVAQRLLEIEFPRRQIVVRRRKGEQTRKEEEYPPNPMSDFISTLFKSG